MPVRRKSLMIAAADSLGSVGKNRFVRINVLDEMTERDSANDLPLKDTWSSPWRTMSTELGAWCHWKVAFSVGVLQR